MIALEPELVATLTALGGGLVGYAVREYRNRVCPLFEVITIIGKIIRRPDSTAIPKDVVDSLRGSFYVGELEADSTLGKVWDCWERCDHLAQFWPEIKADIERTCAANSDEELIRALGGLLDSTFFDKWLLALLLNNRVDFQVTDAVSQEPQRIRTWFEEKEASPMWFDLPPAGKSFGSDMGRPAIRDKCMPFIIALSRLHKPGLKHGMRQFVDVFQQDHTRALSCIQTLKKIKDDNSRWGLTCFLANTSTSPLVVEKRARVTIRDRKTQTKYSEGCYLVLVDEKDMSFTDASTPLIVQAGSGKVFALLTIHKQKDMEFGLGPAIREVYERKEGNCDISVTLARAGVFRRQRYQTNRTPFVPGSDR